MLGGDSCARALLVGLVLGARPGAVVPQRWVSVLRSQSIQVAARGSTFRLNSFAKRMLQSSISRAQTMYVSFSFTIQGFAHHDCFRLGL
jgi:hypothetical protein